jgi:hypothetical protein
MYFINPNPCAIISPPGEKCGLKERIEHEQDCPLLSCADIATLLAHFLSRRDNGVDEVIRQMEERHRKRQTSIDFSYAKQRAGADL